MSSPSKNTPPKGFQPTVRQWFDSRSTYHAKNNCAEAWQQLQTLRPEDAVEPVTIIGAAMFDFQKQQDLHADALSVITDVVAFGTQKQKCEAITHLSKLQKVQPDFIRNRLYIYKSLYDSSLCLGVTALDKNNDITTRVAAANGIKWFAHNISIAAPKKDRRSYTKLCYQFGRQPKTKQLVDGFIAIVKDPAENKNLRDGAVNALQIFTSSPKLNFLAQATESPLLGANKAITQTLSAAAQDQTLRTSTRLKIVGTLGRSLYIQERQDDEIKQLIADTNDVVVSIIQNKREPLSVREAALKNYHFITENFTDSKEKRLRIQFIEDIADPELQDKKREMLQEIHEDEELLVYLSASAMAESLSIDNINIDRYFEDDLFDNISLWFNANAEDIAGGDAMLQFTQNQVSALATQLVDKSSETLAQQISFAANALVHVSACVTKQKNAAERYNLVG